MKYLRKLAYIPLAASLATAPGCRTEDYTSKRPALEQGSHDRMHGRKIDIGGIRMPAGVNVLVRQPNPASSKYVAVVLEGHPRAAGGRIVEESMAQQPALYDAGVELARAGFRNITHEEAIEGLTLEKTLTGMKMLDPSADLSELVGEKDPEKARRLVTDKYLGKGYETSLLLALTYKDLNYMFSVTPEMAINGARYSDTLKEIERFLVSGDYDFVRNSFRFGSRESRREAGQVLSEFNGAIDYLIGNYRWFIRGRTEEMLDSVLSRADDAIIFVGRNHFDAANEKLSALGANRMLMCTDCTAQDLREFEKKFEESVRGLSRYKVRTGGKRKR